MLLYGAFVGGLYWPTALVCSAIMSLTEGTVRQCSPWCLVDCKMKHGWAVVFQLQLIPHADFSFLALPTF